MSDLKKIAAKSALSYLKPNLIVGLGAGSTISYLIEFIDSQIEFKSSIKFVTPSLETEQFIGSIWFITFPFLKSKN